MTRAGSLTRMGREELEMWQSAKLGAVGLLGAVVTFIAPYFFMQDNPYAWVLLCIGAMFSMYMVLFAFLVLMGSYPCVIHKVNGVWEMKR